MLIHQIVSWVVGIGMVAILIYVMWILFERVRNVFNPKKGQPKDKSNQSSLKSQLDYLDTVDNSEEELRPYIEELPSLEARERLPQ